MKMYKFEDRIRLGKRIRKLREQKDISQTKLAKMIDMNNKALSRVEGGKCIPKITTLQAIADVLNVSLDQIIDDDIVDGKEDYLAELNLMASRMPAYELKHLIDYIELCKKTKEDIQKLIINK